MRVIPIRLKPFSVHVNADRRLAFQVLTAFGAAAAESGAASRVVSRDGDRLLVEFYTPGRGLLGRARVFRTLERVSPREPDLIEFEGVEGPLSLLRERLVLEDDDGCTILRHHGEFGLRGWLLGWIVGALVIRPVLARLLRAHGDEMRRAIEDRASRSRVFPQGSCAHGAARRLT